MTLTPNTFRIHAFAASARGAAWMDSREPQWPRDLGTLTAPIDPPLYLQLGLVRGVPQTDDELRAAAKRIEARPGDTTYTPIFTPEQISEGLVAFLEMTGIPVPMQEVMLGRERQIDLAYYGFYPFYSTLAFGLPSGVKLTPEQFKAEGWDRDLAERLLVEGWNAEIQQRQNA